MRTIRSCVRRTLAVAVVGVAGGLLVWVATGGRTGADPEAGGLPGAAATGSPPVGPLQPEAEPGEHARLQGRVRRAAEAVRPAVVAVARPGPAPRGGVKGNVPAGSGVIITADGLVLSQYHVSHQADPAAQAADAAPGAKTTVILHDGTRAEAELLGGDLVLDLSLLRLTKPGPYPHVPVGTGPDPAAGDVVLKAGHPRGYVEGRPPLLRRGRVLWAGEGLFVTDAPIDGGDSGGPYFDPDGRLVGIVFNSWSPVRLSAAGAPTASPGGVNPHSVNALSRLRERVPAMARGEVLRPSPEAAAAAEQWQARAAGTPFSRRTGGRRAGRRWPATGTSLPRPGPGSSPSSTGRRPPRSARWSRRTGWCSPWRAGCRTARGAGCRTGGCCRPGSSASTPRSTWPCCDCRPLG